MIKLSGTIHFMDGSSKEVEATQWAFGQLDAWALKRGFKPIKGMTFLEQMPLIGLRVIAWAASTRGQSPEISFEAWDKTVDEVEFKDDDAVNPTQKEALEGQLPE